MGVAMPVPLPLDVTGDPRPIDRLTARAIHLALGPTQDDAADELVAAAHADLRTLLLAAARLDHARAEEHSTVVERAAGHLRAAVQRLGEH